MNESAIYRSLATGYDRGAAYFSETRSFFWRDLQFIKEYMGKNDKILDFGCGNGRLLDLIKDDFKEYVGVDASKTMIGLAKKKYYELISKAPVEGQISFRAIHPYRFSLPKKYFHTVAAIGVFHHFPPGPIREKIASTLSATLKQGGHIIVTVWDLHPAKFDQFFIKNGKSLREGVIPFKDQQGKNLFDRYHYRWDLKELEDFIAAAGFEIIKSGATTQQDNPANLFVVGRKPSVI